MLVSAGMAEQGGGTTVTLCAAFDMEGSLLSSSAAAAAAEGVASSFVIDPLLVLPVMAAGWRDPIDDMYAAKSVEYLGLSDPGAIFDIFFPRFGDQIDNSRAACPRRYRLGDPRSALLAPISKESSQLWKYLALVLTA